MSKLKSIVEHTPLSKLEEILGFKEGKLKEKKSRLFPLSDKGNITKEMGTTSIFFSVLSAVDGYRNELLSQIGVQNLNKKNIQLHAYTELSLNSEGIKDGARPDALMVLTSGIDDPIIIWTSFVEAKIGTNPLKIKQLKKYVEYGKIIGIKNLITISNHLVSGPTSNPTNFKPRQSKKFDKLFHWSWVYLSITADRLLRDKAIQGNDRIYVLSEFIRYLNGHGGVKVFESMGSKTWEDATIQFRDDKKVDEAINTIVKAYTQEEKNIALKLTDANKSYVKLKKGKKPRVEELKEMLQKSKIINSTFFINGNKSRTFTIDIDFALRKVAIRTQYEIKIGKSKSQITKLLKMLDGAAEDYKILIEAMYSHDKSHNNIKSLADLLKEQEDGVYSIVTDTHQPFMRFEITMKDDLGTEFHKPEKVVTKLESLADAFFKNVFIKLK
ncbi:MAG: hypothetical protein KAI79_15970 [Bacteroidales bacterium]|nr:hypothetical protein [Bacteroidales bacterium]